MDIKETLKKFYDKVNPNKVDYSCNSDEEINELRRLRDAFMSESSKYQEMIDRKIIEKNDGLKYEGQYIRYFHGGEGFAISYIKCTKVERLVYGIRLKGSLCTIYTTGDLDIDMNYTSPAINYVDIDKELEIISKEEYTESVTSLVNGTLNKFLEKNI